MAIEAESTFTIRCSGNQCSHLIAFAETPALPRVFMTLEDAVETARLLAWHVIPPFAYCPDCTKDALNGETVCPKGRH